MEPPQTQETENTGKLSVMTAFFSVCSRGILMSKCFSCIYIIYWYSTALALYFTTEGVVFGLACVFLLMYVSIVFISFRLSKLFSIFFLLVVYNMDSLGSLSWTYYI